MCNVEVVDRRRGAEVRRLPIETLERDTNRNVVSSAGAGDAKTGHIEGAQSTVRRTGAGVLTMPVTTALLDRMSGTPVPG